jgi:hypothetical protein
MKDTNGEKIRAKTMTLSQATQVLERMLERSKKKTHRRALEIVIKGEMRHTGARAAKV